MCQQRVLFFDSGMGGLTILSEVKKLCPGLNCCYLFDNACFPYGDKSEDFIISRVDALLQQAAARFAPDLMVIACNTASTIALPRLRSDITVPVVGVVPAIKPAAKLSRRKIIGLLATPGTVKRHYIDHLIADFAAGEQVLRIGTTVLVEQAEQLLQGVKPDKKVIAGVLTPWLTLPAQAQPDVVVLGCTHFPLLRQEISQILGPDVTLIDSGTAIARRVQDLLQAETAEQMQQRLGRLHYGANRLCCTSCDASIAKRVQSLRAFGVKDIELL